MNIERAIFAISRIWWPMLWHPCFVIAVCVRRFLFGLTGRFVGPSLVSPEGVHIFNVQTLQSYCAIFIFRELDGKWVDDLRGTVSPVVFDVGSNYGVFTAYVRSINPSSRIISVDAWPGMKNLAGGTEHFSLAISNTEGKKDFYRAKDTYHTGTTVPLEDHEVVKLASVPTTTLDQIWESVGSPSVTVLKVDVDGGEEDVISSGVRMLKNTKRVLIEVNTKTAYQSFYRAFNQDHAERNCFCNCEWDLSKGRRGRWMSTAQPIPVLQT